MKIVPAMALALLLLASFVIDFRQTMQNGAVDFRNRITGVRLLEHGVDPYHYIWHAGDPAEFCDLRNNPNMTVSKTTVTPALLVFYAPLAALPYRAAQFAWLFTQWLLLLGTAWLWLRNGATPLQFWLTALAVAALTFTPGWRWEAERGQCYTLLIFLFAYWLTAMRRTGRTNEFVVGCVAGFLVALRPPFALLLPFIALHRRGQIRGVVVGLLLGVIAPLLLHPPVWAEYFAAMQTNSELYRHAHYPPRPPQNFPVVIEGTSGDLLARMVYDYPSTDASVYALARRRGFGPLSDLSVIAVFGALFVLWLLWRRNRSAESLVLAMAAWFFLVDFFLPTTRWGYYDIVVLNVVLAGIASARKFPWPVLPSLLALPLMVSFYAVTKVPLVLLYTAEALLVLSAILLLFVVQESKEKAA